eukprot:8164-Heterococcus_DN1.PRE.25
MLQVVDVKKWRQWPSVKHTKLSAGCSVLAKDYLHTRMLLLMFIAATLLRYLPEAPCTPKAAAVTAAATSTTTLTAVAAATAAVTGVTAATSAASNVAIFVDLYPCHRCCFDSCDWVDRCCSDCCSHSQP